MKYSQWIGIVAVLVIIAGCFLPWAYFPDLNKDFTGFFSEQNRYGRPGKVLFFFGVLVIICFLIPKIWAKRANIFLAGVVLAWSFKSYLLYTACYQGICPTAHIGIFLVLGGAVIVMIATLTPKLPVKQDHAAVEDREQRPGAKAE